MRVTCCQSYKLCGLNVPVFCGSGACEIGFVGKKNILLQKIIFLLSPQPQMCKTVHVGGTRSGTDIALSENGKDVDGCP